MVREIKFHLDENVSNAIAAGLRKRGIDVTTTPEQGLISVSDEVQYLTSGEMAISNFTQMKSD
jgi:hypothetical protein